MAKGTRKRREYTEEELAIKRQKRKERRMAKAKGKTQAGDIPEGQEYVCRTFNINPEYAIKYDRLNIWLVEKDPSTKTGWRRVTGYYRDYYSAFRDLVDFRWKKASDGADIKAVMKEFKKIAEETEAMLKEVIENSGV